MTDTTIVTGLTALDCFDRFRDLFGECARDYVAGHYDDGKRVRANGWWSAYRTLAGERSNHA